MSDGKLVHYTDPDGRTHIVGRVLSSGKGGRLNLEVSFLPGSWTLAGDVPKGSPGEAHTWYEISK